MIPRSDETVQTISIGSQPSHHNPEQKNWQKELSQSVTSPKQLLNILGLSPDLLPGAIAGSQQFQLRVPHSYIARIEPGNPNDPLLKQVLPLDKELEEVPGFSTDPLGEQPKNAHRGIIHKYHGRLLLMPGQACAVNCRFCFRRHFPYDENSLNKEDWQSALDYIRNDTSVSEVIFSGGDPLAVNDKRLAWITEQLADIPHLQRLRIHTRFPVVIPQRITGEMIRWFTGTRLQPVMVVHCNHPQEIDAAFIQAMAQLREHNVQLLNQTALLKGVNDSVDTLCRLSEQLFACGVMPYYLHLLDKVQGAAHFEVAEETARQLLGKMSARCSGYLVPKLAREEAGAAGKTTIAPAY